MFLKMYHSRPLFYLTQLIVNIFKYNYYLYLHSNRGPLVLEANALPTEQLLLPHSRDLNNFHTNFQVWFKNRRAKCRQQASQKTTSPNRDVETSKASVKTAKAIPKNSNNNSASQLHQQQQGQTSPSSSVSRDSSSPPSLQQLQHQHLQHQQQQHMASQMGSHPPPPPLQSQHHLISNLPSDSPEASLPTSASEMAYPSPTITPANDSTSTYLGSNGSNNFWTPINREMALQVKAENLSPSQHAIAAAAAAHTQQYHHHHHPSYASNPYYPGMDLAYFGGQSLNHGYDSHMSSTASMFRSAGMADPYEAYSADRYQLL